MKFPYTYGPRRNEAVQKAHWLLEEWCRAPSIVIQTGVLSDLLDELKQQTHLARQYDRALRAIKPERDFKRGWKAALDLLAERLTSDDIRLARAALKERQ